MWHLYTHTHTHTCKTCRGGTRLSTRPCVFRVLLPFFTRPACNNCVASAAKKMIQKNNETKCKMPKNRSKKRCCTSANPLTIMHTESSCFPLLILIRGCTRTPYSVLSSRDWLSRGAPQRLKRFASHFFTSLIAY